MKNLITIALLGGTMALTACGGDKDGESGDTGAGTTPTGTTEPTDVTTMPDDMITAVQAECPDADTFAITVETNFSVGDALVNIWEVNAGATGWDEEHALVGAPVAGAAGDDIVWSLADDGAWVSGTETLFSCGVHDVSDAMVYVARVFDADGVYEDCAAWGGDTSNIDEVLAMPEGDDMSDHTNYNGVSNPAEITAENCFVF